jgi:hypothetical protein
MEPASAPYVHLADVGDLVSARVCAAVLGSAGIEARLHGESLGPYPVTVGKMAVTQIWVPEPDLDEARQVMMEAEIDHVLGTEERGGAIGDREALPMRLLALVMAGVVAAAVVGYLMRVF